MDPSILGFISQTEQWVLGVAEGSSVKLKLDRNTKSGDISPATPTPYIQKAKKSIVGVKFSASRKLQKKVRSSGRQDIASKVC